jgi:redox-sensitive bicupin YhaK (pirin superfamily)
MSRIAQLRGMNIGTGFRASALRGGGVDDLMDPFLGVDHARMSEPTFATHPHAGFSAVSYLFLDSETGVNNKDSLGTRNLIAPGGLHWTAAGSGVVHDEVPAVTGKTVHMLQIFVNLPEHKQLDAPFALSLEPADVPVVLRPGVSIRVPLGNFGGTRSPLHPPTEVTLLDISLESGAELAIPVAESLGAFILPISGALQIDGEAFDANTPRVPMFEVQATDYDIVLKAGSGPVQVVVFSGKPLRQPVHWQGPMALASPSALNARIAAYHRGEFGTV